jgi:hypothetical protein
MIQSQLREFVSQFEFRRAVRSLAASALATVTQHVVCTECYRVHERGCG